METMNMNSFDELFAGFDLNVNNNNAPNNIYPFDSLNLPYPDQVTPPATPHHSPSTILTNINANLQQYGIDAAEYQNLMTNPLGYSHIDILQKIAELFKVPYPTYTILYTQDKLSVYARVDFGGRSFTQNYHRKGNDASANREAMNDAAKLVIENVRRDPNFLLHLSTNSNDDPLVKLKELCRSNKWDGPYYHIDKCHLDNTWVCDIRISVMGTPCKYEGVRRFCGTVDAMNYTAWNTYEFLVRNLRSLNSTR